MGRFLKPSLSFRPINVAVVFAGFLALGARFQDVFGFHLLHFGLFLRGRAARSSRSEQADTGTDRKRPREGRANRTHR
jgi:hypothetical protein